MVVPHLTILTQQVLGSMTQRPYRLGGKTTMQTDTLTWKPDISDTPGSAALCELGTGLNLSSYSCSPTLLS